MRLATGSVGALLVFVLAGANPVAGHPRDLMSPNRAGPIIRNQTTMTELRSWFGAPDDRRGVRIGCSRLTQARWNPDVTAYLSRGAPGIVVATFIRSERVESDEHGGLRIHTARGLRVGDREGKLRRLYPNAEGDTHAGHTHYRLRTSRNGGYLMAKVIGNRVVRFENWPFEFC
jgi:hypothetical protein